MFTACADGKLLERENNEKKLGTGALSILIAILIIFVAICVVINKVIQKSKNIFVQEKIEVSPFDRRANG